MIINFSKAQRNEITVIIAQIIVIINQNVSQFSARSAETRSSQFRL